MANYKNLKVDAVITWVDGNDIEHRGKMSKHLKNKKSLNNKPVRMRFDQVGEIEFAVKSILKYAKFIRNIYIITDNQKPEFLKDDKIAEKKYPTVSIVDHKDLFEEYSEYLPTFNSLSIETMLYKIPGLAEQFIYFNDDFFLANNTKLEDFFIDNKPLLRGNWSLFYDDIWYKKVKLFFNKYFQKSKKPYYKHNKGLQKPAEILHFNKYFYTPHIPAIFIKSTLKDFFDTHKELLINNIKFKFRKPDQFVVHSLSNHLQIKKENYIHQKRSQLVYFQNYKKPLWWIKFKLRKVEKNKDILFLCMQSLDQCPENKLVVIKKWLSNKYD